MVTEREQVIDQNTGGKELTTKKLRRILGRKELVSIGIGQIIGSGIFSLTGLAIGFTGRSIVLAFLIGAMFSLALTVPNIFASSTVRMRGGQYTLAGLLLGEKFSGFYIVIYIVGNISIAMYALSFSDYLLSLISGIDRTLIAAGVLTVFFLINLFGVKNAARLQNFMVLILAAALAAFCGFGLLKVQPGYVSDPSFFTGGWKGFFLAATFTSFATTGGGNLINLSGECKNPTKDIPFAILCATLLVTVLYTIIGVVAAGVLPVDQVAFQPLTLVATEVLPAPIYVFFIVGGALLALSTTLNATFGWVTKPVLQACVDGWFPRKLGEINDKYGTPHYLLAIFYLIGLMPILTGFDIESIASLSMILMNIITFITIVATYRLPKILPKYWEKSKFKVSNSLLGVIVTLSGSVLVFQNWLLLEGNTIEVLIGNIGLLLATAVFVHLRYKTGKVNIEISYEEN